jgi:hypothetical protein
MEGIPNNTSKVSLAKEANRVFLFSEKFRNITTGILIIKLKVTDPRIRYNEPIIAFNTPPSLPR